MPPQHDRPLDLTTSVFDSPIVDWPLLISDPSTDRSLRFSGPAAPGSEIGYLSFRGRQRRYGLCVASAVTCAAYLAGFVEEGGWYWPPIAAACAVAVVASIFLVAWPRPTLYRCLAFIFNVSDHEILFARIAEFVLVYNCVVVAVGSVIVVSFSFSTGCYTSDTRDTTCNNFVPFEFTAPIIHLLRPRFATAVPILLAQFLSAIIFFFFVNSSDTTTDLLRQLFHVVFLAIAAIVIAADERYDRRRFVELAHVHVVRRNIAAKQRILDALTTAAIPPWSLGKLRHAPSLNDALTPDISNSAALGIIDIADFGHWSNGHLPSDVVVVLHKLFAVFDAEAERCHVTRVATYGDSYTVVLGMPGQPNPPSTTNRFGSKSGSESGSKREATERIEAPGQSSHPGDQKTDVVLSRQTIVVDFTRWCVSNACIVSDLIDDTIREDDVDPSRHQQEQVPPSAQHARPRSGTEPCEQVHPHQCVVAANSDEVAAAAFSIAEVASSVSGLALGRARNAAAFPATVHGLGHGAILDQAGVSVSHIDVGLDDDEHRSVEVSRTEPLAGFHGSSDPKNDESGPQMSRVNALGQQRERTYRPLVLLRGAVACGRVVGSLAHGASSLRYVLAGPALDTARANLAATNADEVSVAPLPPSVLLGSDRRDEDPATSAAIPSGPNSANSERAVLSGSGNTEGVVVSMSSDEPLSSSPLVATAEDSRHGAKRVHFDDSTATSHPGDNENAKQESEHGASPAVTSREREVERQTKRFEFSPFSLRFNDADVEAAAVQFRSEFDAATVPIISFSLSAVFGTGAVISIIQGTLPDDKSASDTDAVNPIGLALWLIACVGFAVRGVMILFIPFGKSDDVTGNSEPGNVEVRTQHAEDTVRNADDNNDTGTSFGKSDDVTVTGTSEPGNAEVRTQNANADDNNDTAPGKLSSCWERWASLLPQSPTARCVVDHAAVCCLYAGIAASIYLFDISLVVANPSYLFIISAMLPQIFRATPPIWIAGVVLQLISVQLLLMVVRLWRHRSFDFFLPYSTVTAVGAVLFCTIMHYLSTRRVREHFAAQNLAANLTTIAHEQTKLESVLLGALLPRHAAEIAATLSDTCNYDAVVGTSSASSTDRAGVLQQHQQSHDEKAKHPISSERNSKSEGGRPLRAPHAQLFWTGLVVIRGRFSTPPLSLPSVEASRSADAAARWSRLAAVVHAVCPDGELEIVEGFGDDFVIAGPFGAGDPNPSSPSTAPSPFKNEANIPLDGERSAADVAGSLAEIAMAQHQQQRRQEEDRPTAGVGGGGDATQGQAFNAPDRADMAKSLPATSKSAIAAVRLLHALADGERRHYAFQLQQYEHQKQQTHQQHEQQRERQQQQQNKNQQREDVEAVQSKESEMLPPVSVGIEASVTVGTAFSALLGGQLLSYRLFGPAVREAAAVLSAGACPSDRTHISEIQHSHPKTDPHSNPPNLNSGSSHIRTGVGATFCHSVVFTTPAFRRAFRGAFSAAVRPAPTIIISDSALATDARLHMSLSRAYRSAVGPTDSSGEKIAALPVASDVPPEGDATFGPPQRWRLKAAGVMMVATLR